MATINLPLGAVAEIRGMEGTEEDILTNPKKMQHGEGINELLANCTLALTFPDAQGGEPKVVSPVQAGDIKRLAGPDRLALLLAVRIESFGPEMSVELRDPANGAPFHVTVDLAKLEAKPAPVVNGTVDAGPYDATLSDGQHVRIKLLDGKTETLLAKTTEDRLTAAMLFRLDEVEGVAGLDLKRWLKKLPIKKRTELRKKMEEYDFGPVTTVTADAPSGTEIKFDVQQDFEAFFPLA